MFLNFLQIAKNDIKQTAEGERRKAVEEEKGRKRGLTTRTKEPTREA